MSKFSLPVQFKLPNKRIHLVVIGAGGTGGYLFPNAVRLANDLNKTGEREVIVTLVDGDIIEEKNITRQNFFFPDLGKNKADLLASRHSKLFGMEITSVRQYIEDEQTFNEIVYVDDYFPIVLSAVDNHKTRQMIHNIFINNPEKFIWIDSGNKKFSGQVVVGYNTSRRLTENDTQPGLFKLPAVTEVFPEILNAESKFNSEISCDDHAVENIQNIAANILSSTEQFILLNQLLARDGELTTYMVRFNAKNGGVTSIPTSFEELKKY